MKDPATTIFLLALLIIVVMWRTGRLANILNAAFGK